MKNKHKKLLATVTLSALVVLGGGFALLDTNVHEATATEQTPEDAIKSALQTKMWSAIDNYKNVKGAYRTFGANGTITTTVEFQVRQGNNPGSYRKITTAAGDVLETRVDGKHLLDKRNGKVEQASEVFPVNNTKKPAHMYESNGTEKAANLRLDPAFAESVSEVTFPQQIALSFLEDYSTWSILGESEFLGHPVTVVSGEFSQPMKEKQQAENYKLWVDKATGMLLKMIETDQAGLVVEGHEVTEIKLNGALDERKMSIAKEDLDAAPKRQK